MNKNENMWEKDDKLETEKKPKKPRKGKNDADVSE